MAISKTHYELLRELKRRGVLPQGGSILEIGQANFYGDFDPKEIVKDLPNDFSGGLYAMPLCPFHVANLIYFAMFGIKPASPITSIDLDPNASRAQRLDLNEPVTLEHQFDTSINHGTAEHIFNIAQVFRTMHDWTKPGGLMIHESPFTGWVDHGFYCLQPTLFYDVAAANGYEVVGVWLEHLASQTTIAIECREHIHHLARADQLPNNAMLFVVLRNVGDSDFKVPMQGVYAGAVSDETKQAWRTLR